MLEQSLSQCSHFKPFYVPYPATVLVATVAYSTLKCLVMMDNVACNPCLRLVCAGDASRMLDLATLKADPECQLSMDQRQLVAHGVVGSSELWGGCLQCNAGVTVQPMQRACS